ncbi:MAG: allophanate hydrolase [Proteobacteria bacterium]|nr:allophanate hydrolase [Pseudomonadota bacterium]
MSPPSLDFVSLRAAYASGSADPLGIADSVLQAIAARGDDGVWIYRVPENEVRQQARTLAALPESLRSTLPLFGLPFSVKDCIDIAGLPTTAACPGYRYIAEQTNLTVRKALDAGAILIGKTNMDQFATGVVGVRTPYGVARNPFDPAYIPGGSSSGAAVSVSAGLCSFAFGTDTGGSGRVPASYNNVVGLKPTLGAFSRKDMVNASRSFDTVSVYALTAPDALAVFRQCSAVDPHDPYSRPVPPDAATRPATGPLRIAIPSAGTLEFYGNDAAAALFAEGVAALESEGHQLTEIDFDVFAATGRMMFEDAWLAERYAAVGGFIEQNPHSVDEIVRQVILGSARFSAAEAFDSVHKLKENVQAIRAALAGTDLLVVPTVGTVYTIDAVRADPLATNATNGRYTNFVNMSDMAAVAVPNGFLPSGIPMGVSFVGPAFSETLLAETAAAFHRARVGTLGATGTRHPDLLPA